MKMGFLLNVAAAGALFGAGYYVGMKRCENGQEAAQHSGQAVYDRGTKITGAGAADPERQCNGPAVAKYLLDRTADGAAKLKRGIDELVQ